MKRFNIEVREMHSRSIKEVDSSFFTVSAGFTIQSKDSILSMVKGDIICFARHHGIWGHEFVVECIHSESQIEKCLALSVELISAIDSLTKESPQLAAMHAMDINEIAKKAHNKLARLSTAL